MVVLHTYMELALSVLNFISMYELYLSCSDLQLIVSKYFFLTPCFSWCIFLIVWLPLVVYLLMTAYCIGPFSLQMTILCIENHHPFVNLFFFFYSWQILPIILVSIMYLKVYALKGCNPISMVMTLQLFFTI